MDSVVSTGTLYSDRNGETCILMCLWMIAIRRLVDAPGNEDNERINWPAQFLRKSCFCSNRIAEKTCCGKSTINRKLGNFLEYRSIESIFRNDLPRCSGDMRGVACNQTLTKPSGESATGTDAVVVLNLV